jgi:hypothetical protein
MARQPRFVLAGHPQRVIIRGNNREPIFCTNENFRFSLEKLKQACDKHDCDLHACVLVTNHVHLLITPNQDDSLSKAIQMLGRYYVLNGSDDLTDCAQPVTLFASSSCYSVGFCRWLVVKKDPDTTDRPRGNKNPVTHSMECLHPSLWWAGQAPGPARRRDGSGFRMT